MTAPPPIAPERLREISWILGQGFPRPFGADQIHFAFVHPHLGFLWWNIGEPAAAAARAGLGEAGADARPVVRVHDVTDVRFDGTNAHHSWDLEVRHLQGNYYHRHNRLGRHLLAEIGLKTRAGAFRPLARSNAVAFDRDRPVRDFRPEGLYVARDFQLVFPVENIFGARHYERLVRELPAFPLPRRWRVAVVHLGWGEAAGLGGPLGAAIRQTGERLARLGVDPEYFALSGAEAHPRPDEPLPRFAERAAEAVRPRVAAAHARQAFDLVHCHDWYSAGVGRRLRQEAGVPFLLQLHSTEHERAQGRIETPGTLAICEREREAVAAADLIAVPHAATRAAVLELYGAAPERVLLVEDPLPAPAGGGADPAAVKQRFHLNPRHPLVLFCGEISHAAGADLLVDCLGHVCQERPTVQFLLAGEGPLRGELEARVAGAGLGARVRFAGHVTPPVFAELIQAADFVVVPARTSQDEGVAQAAIDAGRPVLTTHQAQLGCVQHGKNGLIAYDNPGSITWGIKELLANPPSGGMARAAAARPVAGSADLAAVGLLIAYHGARQRAASAAPA